MFFEIIYFKLNRITLRGQSERNNAHFSLLLLTLLLNFNFITVLMVLDKYKVLSFLITNQYEEISLVVVTYFIAYFLFIRKEKYKFLKEKYSGSDKSQKRKMNKYISMAFS
jgi:hypothetical protein